MKNFKPVFFTFALLMSTQAFAFKLSKQDIKEITNHATEMTYNDDKDFGFCKTSKILDVKVSITHEFRQDTERYQTTSSIYYQCKINGDWKYAQTCEYVKDEVTNKWDAEYCDT